MHPALNIAVKAARRAGQIINRASHDLDLLKVETKQPNDFVTEVDRKAEAAIIELMDEGEDIISLELQPLTGRVRSIHKRVPLPEAREDNDGRAEGDE